jgi:HK97 family phage major capsid protein/HK97 family phage prohead protease
MDNKETRSLPLPSDGEGRNVSGFAANFREYDMGTFRERIERSAFDQLDQYDIHALYNHDYDRVLARRNKGKGTLDLQVKDEGLYFAFELPDTSTGNEVRTLVGRGDVDQASWAFTVKKEEWMDVRSDKPLRVIKEVGEIYDISLTPRGANPTTSAALRSLEAAKSEISEPEQPEAVESKPLETVENHENNEERAANFVDASAVQGKLSKSEQRDLAKFNIIKAMNEARNGRLSGVEAEINQEGLAERRRLGLADGADNAIHMPEFFTKRTNTVTGGASTGGDLVFTEPGRYIDFLYPNTPLLGQVSVFENLVGNVSFPKQLSGYDLNWQTETGADTAQDLTFGTVDMSPKRAVITASVSNQLLKQEYSQGIQARMINTLNQSFNKGVENAILNGTGASNQPSGLYTLLNGSAQELTLGAISFEDLVEMEKTLAMADTLQGNLAYVTSPAVMAKLKTTKVDAGSGRFLVEGLLDPVKTANGYNALSTTLSPAYSGPAYGIAFGNWSDLAVGMWGGASLIVNPYTQMKSSITEIYIEKFMDIAILRDESFVMAQDVTI